MMMVMIKIMMDVLLIVNLNLDSLAVVGPYLVVINAMKFAVMVRIMENINVMMEILKTVMVVIQLV